MTHLQAPSPRPQALNGFAPHSINEVLDAVRTARDEQTPLRIVGSGTWLDAGHPVLAAKSLDLSGLSGIVEYVPGDLVLTMGTGYYEGEGAVSAAIGYLSETGGIGYSAGIGLPLGGDGPVLRAGVSLKLN